MSQLAKSVAQFILDHPTATDAAKQVCRDYLEGRLTDEKLRELHRQLNSEDNRVTDVGDSAINSVRKGE